MVEVMMAIAVMTVGAIAIFTMQNITALGSRRSREVTTATEINRQWIERVKLQAMAWGPSPYGVIPWLDQLPVAGTGTSEWFLPAEQSAGDVLVSAASDFYGRTIAIPEDGAPAPYCTSLRWTWMNSSTDQVVRLDVRTWWHRPPPEPRPEGHIDQCGPDQAALTVALNDIADFGVVYSSTVVRWQGVPE